MPRTYALDKRLAEQREREQAQRTAAAEPQKLTRSEIARKAAKARWQNRRRRDEEIS